MGDIIVSPEQGAAFVGTQGDEVGAQHDVELAMYSAMLMLRFVTVLVIPKRNK